MGIRNRTKELLERLQCKTLEDRFRNEICEGLNCSPFEAKAILQVVQEVDTSVCIARVFSGLMARGNSL